MKNLLPLILFLAFALNSCENKEPTPANPINDVLDFNELVSIMGSEMKQARDKIPGALSEIHTDTGQATWIYHLVPEDINMDDSLRMTYTFVNDTLDDIRMRAPNEEDQLDFTKQITTKAAEQLGEGEYRFIWWGEIGMESKDFNTAKEFWDFVESNNINLTDILQATGTWKVGKYQVFLAFSSSKYLQFTAWIQGPPIRYDIPEVREPIVIADSCGLQLFE
ncbi:hypothetical protein ACFLTA_08615 [Bacteroidota bacterium]